MSKTAATGLGSIVMVLAFTGVYLSKHHAQPDKEAIHYSELPSDVPIIIKLDDLPIDQSVFYNKIVRSIQNENIRGFTSSTIRILKETTPAYDVNNEINNNTERNIVEEIKGVLDFPVEPAQPAVQGEAISTNNLTFDIKSEIPNDISLERREKIKEVQNSIADGKR